MSWGSILPALAIFITNVLVFVWWFGRRDARMVSRDELDHELVELTERVRELQGQITRVTTQIEVLASPFADMRATLELLRTRTHELNAQIMKLPSELDKRFVPRDVADIMFTQSHDDRVNLRAGLESMRARLDELRPPRRANE